ncbi:MAG: hypothetical protein APR54_01740 [Candidatus Cloacimonas sp. SDB]|nr:MAG: hypothetical protein APR54_01740 [Candidatus Cloacimonas sp. SDB]
MALSERQSQIVEAAINIIAEQGIQNLTTKRLAADLQVTEPALYRHFKNKQDILKHIIGYFQDTMSPVMNKLNSTGSAPDKIINFIKDHFSLLETKPSLAKIIFVEPIFHNDFQLKNTILTMMTNSQEKIHKVIQQGIDQNKFRSDISAVNLTRIIIGSMKLIVTQWSMSGMMFNLSSEGVKLAEDIRILIQK